MQKLNIVDAKVPTGKMTLKFRLHLANNALLKCINNKKQKEQNTW